jgi:hypothetical protein
MRRVIASLFVGSLIAAASVSGALATPWIELQMNPMIPGHIENPGGVLTAHCWLHESEYSQRMLKIEILDPDGAVVWENTVWDVDYFSTDWTCPTDAPEGVYHYRVTYTSDYWETTETAPFLVAGLTAGICSYKFIDVDGNGAYDPAIDTLATGWEICVTPPAAPGCKTTGEDFVVCWFFLPVGAYTVCETQQPGYTPTTPPCVDVDVTAGTILKVEFGNMLTPPSGACCLSTSGPCVVITEAECLAEGGTYYGDGTECDPSLCPPIATEPSTWGAVKANHR